MIICIYRLCYQLLIYHQIGGYNRGECLESVECFNTLTNTWTAMPSLPHPRGRFAATVIVDESLFYYFDILHLI